MRTSVFMMTAPSRIILIDPDPASGAVLVKRLTAQGYTVDTAEDPAVGADMALASPPAAVVADLWMPRISGVQLCRLLRAEPATAEVPIILRGEADSPRGRFWAERAGATAFVRKGSMGELVRALLAAKRQHVDGSDFFMQLSPGQVDIRDRIAAHLDQALFDSVIAAEVRALATCGSFERVFDMLSQLAAQLLNYRWMGVTTSTEAFGLHCHPSTRDESVKEARAALGVGPDRHPFEVVDGDARPGRVQAEVSVHEIPFGGTVLGRIAIAALSDETVDAGGLCWQLAQQLGGPIRMAALIEEQQRLATIDPLTGLMNRRSFGVQLETELARVARYGAPLSVILLDLDHFKSINDVHGHAAGDQVLAETGQMLQQGFRACDLVGRWGGEEFVLALVNTDTTGARVLAERIRKRAEEMNVTFRGQEIEVSASLGVTAHVPGEPLDSLIERADRAMYVAKTQGRNRVAVVEHETRATASTRPQHHGSKRPGEIASSRPVEQ